MVYENAVSIHVQVGYGQSNMSSHVQLTQTRLHIIYCHCVLFAPAIYNITSHEGPVFYCIWDRCQSRSTTCVGWCPAVCAAHEPPGCFWKKYKQVLRSDTVDARNPKANHLGCIFNPVNNGRNYQPQLVSRISSINLPRFDPWRKTCDFPRFEVIGVKVDSIHPRRLTWNLQITHLERKVIFQASMRTCSSRSSSGV